jgi:DNA-binding NarL/FixJ family response regulator
MISILLADDHPIVRQGLKQILSVELDVSEVGEASSAADVLRLARSKEWSVIILDLAMPGRSGLDVLADLRREHPNLPVLVLSMHPEDQFAVQALRAGASSYLTKGTAADELAKAVRKIIGGGKYITAAVAERLALDLERGADRPAREQLSDREYLVMTMIASGKTVTDIAMELSLSVKTVSTYRTRILRKLDLKNTAALVRYALVRELVK